MFVFDLFVHTDILQTNIQTKLHKFWPPAGAENSYYSLKTYLDSLKTKGNISLL